MIQTQKSKKEKVVPENHIEFSKDKITIPSRSSSPIERKPQGL